MIEQAYWCRHYVAEPDTHQNHRYLDNEQFHKLQDRYVQALYKMRQVLLCVQAGQPITEADVAKVTQDLYDDLELYLSVIHMMERLLPLNSSKRVEFDTIQRLSMHSINTALYSLALAKWTRLGEQQRKALLKAALLHDIGKTGISEEILSKRGKLDNKEVQVIKQHSYIGYDIACQTGFLDEIICDSILMHHERIDGKGYPRGLCENAICDFAKIIAIADTFDAVTSDHVYKCRSLPFEALRILESMKENRLESWRTSEFISKLINYYMGSSVLLNTGAVGEIVFISPIGLTEPIIRLGQKLVDLSFNKDIRVVRFVGERLRGIPSRGLTEPDPI